MTLFKKILIYIISALVSLVAAVFMFVEFRSLFAGDFALMNNPGAAAVGYLFRGLYFLLIIALAVFIILFTIHKKKICIILFSSGLALFFGSLLSFMFYDQIIALVIVFITFCELVITAFGFFKKEQDNCQIN